MKKILVCLFGLYCSTVLYFPGAYAQQNRNKTADLYRKHEEKEDDPYLPNQWNNQRLSPPYRYVQSGSNHVNRSATAPSTIFTTQVNVGPGAGQNIVGDAANEPSIAVSQVNPDAMVIGWRQFDNVTSNFRQAGWAYTNDGGQQWVFVGAIEFGTFRSDPVLDHDASGNFFYNSLTNSPTYMCKVFQSDDGGASWDVGTDAYGGDKQWMAIDRSAGPVSNNIYSFWTSAYSVCIPGDFTRSPDNGVQYEPCDSIPGSPALGTMTVDRNGVLYVAGVSDLTDSLIVVKSLNAKFDSQIVAWEPYVPVYMDGSLNGWTQVNPVGLYGQINIAVDLSNGPGQDNVYLLAPVARYSNFDPSDIMISRSTDGGLSWSPPVRINDDVSTTNTQWFGTMSVAPTGRIDVVWLDTREDFAGLDSSALYYSYSTDQGVTWSANEKMSDQFDPHTGYPNQDKIGDYFDMESDSLGAHLSWAGTFNGEQDVYYSYIQPPITSGLNPAPQLSAWSIYPNPSNGIFYLTGIDTEADLELTNMHGQLIFSSHVTSRLTPIDLTGKAQGVYFLRILEKSGTIATKKLVIQ